MKAGETKSFDMTFPEDYHGKDVAGKKVTFTIVMHSVEAPRLPELDAAFVKVWVSQMVMWSSLKMKSGAI